MISILLFFYYYRIVVLFFSYVLHFYKNYSVRNSLLQNLRGWVLFFISFDRPASSRTHTHCAKRRNWEYSWSLWWIDDTYFSHWKKYSLTSDSTGNRLSTSQFPHRRLWGPRSFSSAYYSSFPIRWSGFFSCSPGNTRGHAIDSWKNTTRNRKIVWLKSIPSILGMI